MFFCFFTADPPEPPSENSIRGNPTRLLPLTHPSPLFMPPFPNILRHPPNPPPNMSRAPVFRIRLPDPGPYNPEEDFLHPGVVEAESWIGGPFRRDGPSRAPLQCFGPEPSFRPGAWSRGGHWGHGQYRHWKENPYVWANTKITSI